MTRICTIEVSSCEKCPHFDYEYYSYNEHCKLLNKKIPYKQREKGIPSECPLPIKTCTESEQNK